MYQQLISQTLTALNISYNPRHVEAYMVLEHGTLNHLSSGRFMSEVRLACNNIDMEGTEIAEELAKSYGI